MTVQQVAVPGVLNQQVATPGGVSGLAAWFDAGRITGTSDGGALTQWDDVSGNNRHLTGTATYRLTGHNSLPTVEFNGTTDIMVNHAIGDVASGDFTMIAGVRYLGTLATDKYAVGFGNSSSTTSIFAFATGPLDAEFVHRVHHRNVTNNNYYSPFHADGFALSVIRRTGTTTTPFVQATRGNFASNASTTFNTFSVGALTRTTVGLYANAQVSEVLVYNRYLTDDELGLLVEGPWVWEA